MTSSPSESFRQFLLSPAQTRKSWASLILVILVLMLFSPILFSGNHLVSTPAGDLANQFLGWRVFGFSELAKGHITLWNPFIFCGAPYFAGFQSALLYPLNWFFLFLPPLFALNFSVALHVFLAGLFAYLWLAGNRLAFFPALFGSFVYMFGGAFYAHVTPGHLTNLCAMAWIPLVFLSVEKLLESPRLENLLIGAGILALQLLAGHPQYFLYTILFAALYALALVFSDPSRWKTKILMGLVLGLTVLGVTAIQWLPGWKATGEFGRDISSNFDNLDFFSIHWSSLISAVAPGFISFPDPHGISFSGSRIWWESCLFVGAACLFWGASTLFDKESKMKHKWVPVGLALLALLLALGPHTPFYPLLVKIPPFGFFRGGFKFVIFFQAFFALLSARGLHSALARSEGSKGLSLGALGFSILFILGAFYFWLKEIPFLPALRGLSAFHTDNTTVGLSWALAGFTFLFFGLFGASPNWKVKTILAFLGMLELFCFAAFNTPSFNAEEWLGEGQAAREKMGTSLGDGRVYWGANNDRTLLISAPSIWGDDPLPPKRLQAFVAFQLNAPPLPPPSIDSEVLNLTPVKMALMRLGFFLSQRAGQIEVTPNSVPRFPRITLVGGFQKAGDMNEALEILSRPGFNPQSEVVLEGTPDPPPVENGGLGRMTLKSHTSDWLELTVETDKPQILLVTDSFATGWKASAYPDSAQKAYQVLPADVFARAIPLSAGTHHFDLVYDAPGFTAGKWISAFSLLAYLLAWGWVWRRKEAKP